MDLKTIFAHPTRNFKEGCVIDHYVSFIVDKTAMKIFMRSILLISYPYLTLAWH
jgi:hypothetical protein